MAQRLKGQEVSINVMAGGVLEDTITAIQNFNVEDEFEILSQGYLGETTDRKDMVFKGVKGDFELHIATQDFLKLTQKIKDKARRVTPDVEFNLTATLNFPNGDTPTITFPDVAWGPIGKNTSSRSDYVKCKMQWACSDDDTQLS